MDRSPRWRTAATPAELRQLEAIARRLASPVIPAEEGARLLADRRRIINRAKNRNWYRMRRCLRSAPSAAAS